MKNSQIMEKRWIMKGVRLVPLERDDREQLILDNQEAFNYGALDEFVMPVIVEYYNRHHKDPNEQCESSEGMQENMDGMFRFEKKMK